MKKEGFKYRFLTAIRYLGDGFFYPFFSLYLQARGLSESQLGFLLSISPLLGILLNPVYTKLCKTVNITRKVLGIISILEGIIIYILSMTDIYYLLVVLTFILAIFGSCHYSLMDSLLATYADSQNKSYSSIRIFGSGAYIFATLFSGKVADNFGYTLAFLIAGLLFAAAGVSYLLLKPIEYKKEDTSDYEIPIKELFKNKNYLKFVVFFAMLKALYFSSGTYLSTYLTDARGLTNGQYGLVYSYFVGVELIMIIIYNKLLKNVDIWIMFAITPLMFICRSTFCLIDAPIWPVVLATGFRGIEYSTILHYSYSYMVKTVGEKAGQKAIMIAELGYAIFLFGFNNIFGPIITNVGYRTYYTIVVILASILALHAITVCIINLIKKKRGVINEQ